MQLSEGNRINGHLLVERRYRGFNKQVNNSILFVCFCCFVLFFMKALPEGDTCSNKCLLRKSSLTLHPECSLKPGIQICLIFCYGRFCFFVNLL